MRWIGLLVGLVAGFAHACDEPAPDSSRVAVAGGSITEVMFFLGVEDRIVAVDTTSNYPPEATEIPSVGYVRALSTEGLLSLNPTLILGEHDMGPPAVVEQVTAAGVDVITVAEVHTAEGIIDKVRCISMILDIEEHGEQMIDSDLRPIVEALGSMRADAEGRTLKGAVILGLRDGAPLGAGTETSGNGLLEMAGATNVLAEFSGWKPVSIEAMLQADPDFLVVPQRGVDDAGGADALLAHPGLRLTTAAREGNLVAMDGMSMLGFGPRTLTTALQLANQIYGRDSALTADSP